MFSHNSPVHPDRVSGLTSTNVSPTYPTVFLEYSTIDTRTHRFYPDHWNLHKVEHVGHTVIFLAITITQHTFKLGNMTHEYETCSSGSVQLPQWPTLISSSGAASCWGSRSYLFCLSSSLSTDTWCSRHNQSLGTLVPKASSGWNAAGQRGTLWSAIQCVSDCSFLGLLLRSDRTKQRHRSFSS